MARASRAGTPVAPCVTVPTDQSPHQPGCTCTGRRFRPTRRRTASTELRSSTVSRTIVDLRARARRSTRRSSPATPPSHSARDDGPTSAQCSTRAGDWPGSPAPRERRSGSVTAQRIGARIAQPADDHRHDLPPPALQAELRDRFGRFVGRVDFLFVELRAWSARPTGWTSTTTARQCEEHEHGAASARELGYGFVRWQSADLRTSPSSRNASATPPATALRSPEARGCRTGTVSLTQHAALRLTRLSGESGGRPERHLTGAECSPTALARLRGTLRRRPERP